METVSFFTFLEEKITEILFQLFFLAVVAFLLIFYGVDMLFVVLLVILFISIQGLFQWCLYRKKRNASQHIIDLVDGLEETYYIADVLPKPKEFQNEAYYYALKKACKSMNDEIGKITDEKQDYQEYVESFAHEIKIPIGALSLTFDNTKNYTLKKETDKIFQLVEQMLYYARSENTEKDYFVKQLQLDEVIHNVILKFRHSLMERKAIINIHDIENVIYTDEKWLTFILSQIVQNAIKYFDKQENKLTIYSQDNGTNILLPLNIIQWVSIILWITTGIQWLFWGYILVAIPYAIFIIRFLSKRIVYICPQCHEIFKPHLKEFIFSNHSMTLRKLTCTSCGYHGFCVETYREEEKNNE